MQAALATAQSAAITTQARATRAEEAAAGKFLCNNQERNNQPVD